MSFNIENMVKALNAKSQQLFLAINEKEWQDKNIGSGALKKVADYETTAMYAAMEWFNKCSFAIEWQIMQQENLHDRVEIFKVWLDVAAGCLETHNYFGFMAIMAAFNSIPIARLTIEILSLPIEFQNKLSELKSFASDLTKKSYKILRERLEAESDAIPYIGMYNTDLTFIYDGNKNNPEVALQIAEEKVFAPLRRKLAAISKMQYAAKCSEPLVASIDSLTSAKMNEDALYELSLKLNPKYIKLFAHNLLEKIICAEKIECLKNFLNIVIDHDNFNTWQLRLENILGPVLTTVELENTKAIIFTNFYEPFVLQQLGNTSLAAIVKDQQRHLDYKLVSPGNLKEAKRLLGIFEFETGNTQTLSHKKLRTKLNELLGIKLNDDEANVIKQAIYHKSLKSISLVIAELATGNLIKSSSNKTIISIKHLNVAMVGGNVTKIISGMKDLGVATGNIREDDLAVILLAQQLLDQKNLYRDINCLMHQDVIHENKLLHEELNQIENCLQKLEVVAFSAPNKKIQDVALIRVQSLKIRQAELLKIAKQQEDFLLKAHHEAENFEDHDTEYANKSQEKRLLNARIKESLERSKAAVSRMKALLQTKAAKTLDPALDLSNSISEEVSVKQTGTTKAAETSSTKTITNLLKSDAAVAATAAGAIVLPIAGPVGAGIAALTAGAFSVIVSAVSKKAEKNELVDHYNVLANFKL